MHLGCLCKKDHFIRDSELASLPLTLWAQGHGYTKLQPNLKAV